LLFRRVLDSFGIRRIGRRIEELFERLLDDIQESNDVRIRGTTISLGAMDMEVYRKPRVSSEEQRPFTLIPQEELAGAIIDLVKNNIRIAQESIASDVARGIYNNNRIGTQIESKVEDAVDYLIKKKLIKLKDGMLTLAEE